MSICWPQPILRLRLIYRLLRLAGRPDHTELLFDINDILSILGTGFAETVRRLHAEPESRNVIRERKLLSRMDLDTLLLKAEGSLGREFAVHMKRNGLNPEFFRVRDIRDDVDLIIMRTRQTHDLWHVVTGFNTDVVDEIGLQAFVLSYLALPLSLILVGSTLLQAAIQQTDRIGPLACAIAKGMAMSSQVKGLFAYDWEANWDKPLAQVRAELKLF